MGLTLANTINDMRIVVNDVVDNVAAISLDTIDNLGDVDISGVNDQHILQFNSATQNFESVEFPATVAGSDTQIQFNNGGELSGDANLTFNISTSELSVPLVNASTLTTSTAEITTGNIDSLTANSVEVTTGNVDSLTANTLDVTTGNVDSLTANSVEITSGNVDSLTANTINASGVVCASSFEGDGSSLTGIDLTNLSNVESLTFDSTGDEEFRLPSGATAQRPANPIAGYVRFNTDGIGVEVFSGDRWVKLGGGFKELLSEPIELSSIANDGQFIFPPLEVEYLVIAGGGSGGMGYSVGGGGGGGAGGYRSSVIGESSGGGASAESIFNANTETDYSVTVGAGGSGTIDRFNKGIDGSCTSFGSICSRGGGGGGSGANKSGRDGGSGGGSVCCTFGGDGTANQGFCGLLGTIRCGGNGGGGAGGVGGIGAGGAGGIGVNSSITGTSVGRAGGGGGGGSGGGSAGGVGVDGGGDGAVCYGCSSSENGTTNTGGGGGGRRACPTSNSSRPAGSGGSGVVILRYPSSYSINIGAGLCGSESTVGTKKVATITSGTGNVCWS